MLSTAGGLVLSGLVLWGIQKGSDLIISYVLIQTSVWFFMGFFVTKVRSEAEIDGRAASPLISASPSVNYTQ